MLARLAVAFVLLAAAATIAGAETRVALVIGNGAYAEVKPSLPNPPTDASAIGAKLGELGFDVEVVIDGTKEVMEDAMARLAKKARTADVTLLFYAGHGIQDLGENYLAPVNASLTDETDLRRRFVRLRDVLDDLATASGAVVLILDACRDNVAVEALREVVPKTRSAGITRGLAPVPKTNGMLVAFATQPTRVAADGVGDHSPFTEALIEHLDDPGAELRTVLTRVRVAVAKATGNLQIPETSDSLLGEIYLTPAEVVPEVEARPQVTEPPPDETVRVEPPASVDLPPEVTIPPGVENPATEPPPEPVYVTPEYPDPNFGASGIPGCTRRPCGEALVKTEPLSSFVPLTRNDPEPVYVTPNYPDPNFGASGIPGCTKRPCPEAYQ